MDKEISQRIPALLVWYFTIKSQTRVFHLLVVRLVRRQAFLYIQKSAADEAKDHEHGNSNTTAIDAWFREN